MQQEDALDEWWRERCELEALMQENGAEPNYGRSKSVAQSGYGRNEFQTRRAWQPLDATWEPDVVGWAPTDSAELELHTPGEPFVPAGVKRYVDVARKHGGSYTYVRLKCRCDKCRAWKAAYERARRG